MGMKVYEIYITGIVPPRRPSPTLINSRGHLFLSLLIIQSAEFTPIVRLLLLAAPSISSPKLIYDSEGSQEQLLVQTPPRPKEALM